MINTYNTKKISRANYIIALNKKAKYRYRIEQRFEAGIILQGWEVKSIRGVKVQISEAHIIIRYKEAFLLNAIISPIVSTSTHIKSDDSRMRKLLLHKKEINQLIGFIKRKGYTVIPTSMYWKRNIVKLEIALGKGKKDFDKRAAKKEQDWKRYKELLFKKGIK